MPYSIIIPSRNRDNVTRCMAAIRESGCNARIIIIDDTETLELNHRNIPGFPTSIPGARPFCFARNVNIGIKAAGTDDVIIMNDDALLVTDRGFASLTSFREFGIVSAAISGDSCSFETQCQARGIREAKGRMVPFVCVFIPRLTIKEVGLLEERFEGVYGGEDDDYCYRVRKAGLLIGVDDGCIVEHGTLRSTFRPDGRGLDITETRKRFKQIHGFEMGSK